MKLSIRSKLLTAFALLLILSSLIQGVTFIFTRDYVSSQIIEFQKLQAQKGASEVQKFFTELGNNSFGLARLYQEDINSVGPAANYILKSNTYIKKIAILSPLGRELIKFDFSGQVPDDQLTYEVPSEPFDSAVKGATAISKVYYTEKGLGPHVDLFSPIFADNNTIAGVVKTQINLTLLRDALADIKLGLNGYIYIVDNEGRLITHPSAVFVLSRPTLTDRKIVANALADIPSSPADQQYINEANVKVIGQAVRIPGYNWVAVFEQPVAEAFGFLDIIRYIFIITIICSSFFLIIIALILSENLTRPIRKLQQSAQLIAKGQLTKTVTIKTGDEIESLSNSFSTLIDQLLSRGYSLENYATQLQSANQQLKELDKIKDEFVYMASHELRTPMTAIKNYLWLALNKHKDKLDESLTNDLNRAYISTERLIRLVQDMLTVSRIEGNRLVFDIKPVKVEEAAAQIVDELMPAARERNLNLIFVKPPESFVVNGDYTRIMEVLQNFIGNSLKFTPAGGSITVSIRRNNGMIETSVSDTGVGIPKEDLPRLFQKFGRLGHSYKRFVGETGTGLGLFITKQIVEAHGGRIWVTSEVEHGSTFTFALPEFKGV